MKRISILACILGMCFVSMAWAQQPATKLPIGRHLQHRRADQTSMTPGLTINRSFRAQINPNDATKGWELGTYPGGTWFATWHINDLGMIVGLGDVPPIGRDGTGHTHTLAVPVFGPNAGKWIDLGALSKKQPNGWEEPFNDISNTGLVVSHSTAKDGHMHAVSWTNKTGMVDLGTLGDTGNPEYNSFNLSAARVTNKLGTLIAGVSGVDGNPLSILAPVVWTPSNAWVNGKFVTKWRIHKLDTAAFPNLPMWDIFGMNDSGQIIGFGFDSVDTTIGIAALWNPRPDGKGWELTVLPPSSVCPLNIAYGINEKGEIVGNVFSSDYSCAVSLLWEPLDWTRRTYSQPIELAMPKGGFISCEGVGINDLGDMVGDCLNEDFSLDLPTRWSTNDLTFSEIINFPADWGFAWGVNNNRIASITYNGENCPGDTYGSCAGAVKLH